MDEKKLKVAIYSRVGREEQPGLNTGINNQKLLCNEFLSKYNISSKKYYIDNGFTGTNYNRPAYREMMNDIMQGNINLILVCNLTRFGRNYDVLEKIYELKNIYKTDFISLDSIINTKNNMKEFEYLISLNDKCRLLANSNNKKYKIKTQVKTLKI